MRDGGEIGLAQDNEEAEAELAALKADELRTAAFYEAAAASSRDLGAIRLLGCLADFEREHHETLCRSSRTAPARRSRGPTAVRSRPLPGDLRISRRGLVGAERLLATLEAATQMAEAA